MPNKSCHPILQPDLLRKRIHIVATLSISLLLTFRTIQYFPGMKFPQETWFFLVGLALFAIYMPWRYFQHLVPDSFEIYLLSFITILPLWSALAANTEFGQPIILGLLTGRGLVLACGAPLLLGLAFKKNLITTRELESSFLWLAWGTAGIYALMSISLNPTSYYEPYSKLLSDGRSIAFVGLDSRGAPQFKFDPTFMLFGFFYYISKGIKQESALQTLLAILFAIAILFEARGRSLLLAMLSSTSILIFLWNKNKKKAIIRVLQLASVAALIMAAVSFLNKEFYTHLTSDFSEACSVVLTQERGNDSSANARIGETLVALPYIEKNYLFGSGILSAKWHGGFEGTLGEYFHPSDIGLIGVVFLFGFIGLFYFSAQFYFSIKFSNKLPPSQRHVALVDACKGMLLFFGIRSVAAAHFVHYPEITLTLLSLIYYHQKYPLKFKTHISENTNRN